MAIKLYTATQLQTRLEQLIDGATRQVVLVSPYLTLIGDVDHVGRAVHRALKKGRQVEVFFRLDDGRLPEEHEKQKQKTYARLRSLMAEGLKVFTVAGLHAKLYVADNAAIITSMNLLHSSMSNIEFGLHVQAPDEVAEAQRFFREEIRSLAKPLAFEAAESPPAITSHPTGPAKARRERHPTKGGERDDGFCIHCGDRIKLNPDRPLCPSDFREWSARVDDPNYREEFCHECGATARTSMRKPLCRDCFEASRDAG
ncbi:MAG: phospholipase D family protein [Deltaproteobacteria bacterium]|nr:phospholipase D family protein [Deltaproteobacteria bacterium]